MHLPTQQECIKLWDKYKIPENIRKHSLQVAKVADAVARHIKNQGHKVNLDLVNCGALLHDIAKIITLKNQLENNHGELGAKIVLKEGYSQALANIILRHKLNDFAFNLSLEEQVVSYADKRVTHDKIVTLTQRAIYLKKRYPRSRPTIKEKLPLFFEFERKYGIKRLALDS
jgi:putative nucleotidyltransferase with HDIG domain